MTLSISNLKNRITEIADWLYFGLIKNSKVKYNGNPPIVYICEANMPRLGRMLKHLRKIRNEPFIVFVHRNKFFTKFSNEEYGIEYRIYRSRAHLKFQLKNISDIKLIHGVESRSVYPSVGTDFNKSPFIFDYQDLYVNYFGLNPKIKWVRRNLKFEKRCLQRADGIIGYSLEYIPARRTYKIAKKTTIYFPFYLDDENIKLKKAIISNKIKLVYVGGISPIDKNDSFNLTLLDKYFQGTSIELNIYPSPTTPVTTIKGYEKFCETNLNFKLHKSIPQSELSSKLSEFDFGFIPFYKSEGFLSDTKFKYSTTLKLFNYIESGIPVITMNYTEYQSWFVKHNKLGISISEEELYQLENKIKSYNYFNLKTHIEQFQMQNHLSDKINKISELYDRILNQYQNS